MRMAVEPLIKCCDLDYFLAIWRSQIFLKNRYTILYRYHETKEIKRNQHAEEEKKTTKTGQNKLATKTK